MEDGDLTYGQIFGRVLTLAVVTPIVVITETGLFILQIIMLGEGPPGVLIDLLIIPIEIVVADFEISLAIYTYESFSTGKDVDFEWQMTPILFELLPEWLQNEWRVLWNSVRK